MAFRGLRCAFGQHLLRLPGVLITNRRHINFIQKALPEFRPDTRVCEECKRTMEKIYNDKLARALQLKSARTSFTISSNSTTDSGSTPNYDNLGSSTTDATDDGPSTSAQASAKRKRIEERKKDASGRKDDYTQGINVIRGIRLPHITPAPRRRQIVQLNDDVMNMYTQDIHGG